jgi:hypothetical protein
MKFLLDYGFTNEEIENFSENAVPVLLESIFNSYKLVSKNLDYLKGLGVNNYKEIFVKFYDMFLMDNSNFMNVFNKYDHDDLVDKIVKNSDIVEFL